MLLVSFLDSKALSTSFTLHHSGCIFSLESPSLLHCSLVWDIWIICRRLLVILQARLRSWQFMLRKRCIFLWNYIYLAFLLSLRNTVLEVCKDLCKHWLQFYVIVVEFLHFAFVFKLLFEKLGILELANLGFLQDNAIMRKLFL